MAKEAESQQPQSQSTQQSSEDKLASKLLDEFAKAVLVKSENLDDSETLNGHGNDPSDAIGKISLTKVHGIDLNSFHDPKHTQGDAVQAILSSYFTVGYQGTHLAKANDIITRMLQWTPTEEQIQEDESYQGAKCKIFLGYTSNLVSSGLREYIRYLVQHSLVDVVVSTAGGVEEDLIKCLAPTLVADFALNGTDLRKRGLNRIGNLLVPNDNYCKFEEWVTPILDAMLEEQTKNGVNWTPSKVIHRLGKEINDESSICYWAYKNQIPIYCPAITDGSLGDMLFFHSIKHPGLRIDLMEDIQGINKSAMFAKCTGCIILGAGVVKHHICNANLMRNGADFAVYVNTSNEFDGSDAGASCDEAVSWGKLKSCSTTSDMIKVTADATLVFPLMVSQTFFPFHRNRMNNPSTSS